MRVVLHRANWAVHTRDSIFIPLVSRKKYDSVLPVTSRKYKFKFLIIASPHSIVQTSCFSSFMMSRSQSKIIMCGASHTHILLLPELWIFLRPPHKQAAASCCSSRRGTCSEIQNLCTQVIKFLAKRQKQSRTPQRLSVVLYDGSAVH